MKDMEQKKENWISKKIKEIKTEGRNSMTLIDICVVFSFVVFFFALSFLGNKCDNSKQKGFFIEENVPSLELIDLRQKANTTHFNKKNYEKNVYYREILALGLNEFLEFINNELNVDVNTLTYAEFELIIDDYIEKQDGENISYTYTYTNSYVGIFGKHNEQQVEKVFSHTPKEFKKLLTKAFSDLSIANRNIRLYFEIASKGLSVAGICDYAVKLDTVIQSSSNEKWTYITENRIVHNNLELMDERYGKYVFKDEEDKIHIGITKGDWWGGYYDQIKIDSIHPNIIYITHYYDQWESHIVPTSFSRNSIIESLTYYFYNLDWQIFYDSDWQSGSPLEDASNFLRDLGIRVWSATTGKKPNRLSRREYVRLVKENSDFAKE